MRLASFILNMGQNRSKLLAPLLPLKWDLCMAPVCHDNLHLSAISPGLILFVEFNLCLHRLCSCFLDLTFNLHFHMAL